MRLPFKPRCRRTHRMPLTALCPVFYNSCNVLIVLLHIRSVLLVPLHMQSYRRVCTHFVLLCVVVIAGSVP